LAIKDKQPLIQSTGLVVEWGQVVLNASHMYAQDEPINRLENESNHDLIVLTTKDNFAKNNVHENLDDDVLIDDHESKGFQADYDNMDYENQGAESDGESTPEIMPEHGQIEANDAQEYAEDVQDEEPNPEEIGVSVHEVHVNNKQTNESNRK